MRITKNDILLMAAQKLRQPFTAEDLTVAAWTISHEKFGLEGFEGKYPNNNIILCSLMGKDGLARKGKLVQLGRGKDRKYKLP